MRADKKEYRKSGTELETEFYLCMCVFVFACYMCHPLPSWPPVSVCVGGFLCQPPVTQCHPNQIDRGRHTAMGPKFPIPFTPHPSISLYMSASLHLTFAASLYFTVMLSLSAFHSLTLLHTLINSNLCMCSQTEHYTQTQLHVVSHPCDSNHNLS